MGNLITGLAVLGVYYMARDLRLLRMYPHSNRSQSFLRANPLSSSMLKLAPAAIERPH